MMLIDVLNKNRKKITLVKMCYYFSQLSIKKERERDRKKEDETKSCLLSIVTETSRSLKESERRDEEIEEKKELLMEAGVPFAAKVYIMCFFFFQRIFFIRVRKNLIFVYFFPFNSMATK